LPSLEANHLQTSLTEIVKEAMGSSADGFTKLVNEATQLLEKENGKLGRLQILGRLVEMKPLGEALVVGDLHGDLESLVEILQQSQILERMKMSPSVFLIFLGDYGDRGEFSAEVYSTVLSLKLTHLTQVVLMRGNHEGPRDLLASPHDLPSQFQDRFGKEWTRTYNAVLELFPFLYNAVLVEGRYLIVHAGLPQHARKVEDFAYAHSRHPEERFLEDMLWSDPYEPLEGVYPSPRGAGQVFGKDVTSAVLKAFNVRILIRGHEPCSEGFKIDHDGKVLTLFSRRGSPYFNQYGAYLDVDLSKKFQNATQLVPYVHKF
jgi:diadenosine tetraphosphatase ApaH/serine/threonine PP2A family protein phosphatase